MNDIEVTFDWTNECRNAGSVAMTLIERMDFLSHSLLLCSWFSSNPMANTSHSSMSIDEMYKLDKYIDASLGLVLSFSLALFGCFVAVFATALHTDLPFNECRFHNFIEWLLANNWF